MYDTDRSAYPHPDEFKVKRPEYTQLEDGYYRATIEIAPFKVVGESRTKAGARRVALYRAALTYRSYHPSYRVENPYPDEFVDQEGTRWRRLPPSQRELGDYAFVGPDGEEDYATIEQMLMWDIRPAATPEAEEAS